MRKFIYFGLLVMASLVLLSACVKNPDSDEPKEPNITSKPETEGGSIETGDGYGFSIFDLTIEVDGEKTVHTDYNVEDKAEATYMDKTKEIDVSGKDAMDELFYLFDHLRLTKDMPDAETIERIMEHYELDDYSTLSLDVDFDEGTTLRLHDE